MIKRMIRALLQWAHSDEAQRVSVGYVTQEDDVDGFNINYRIVSNGAIVMASAYSDIAELRLLK